jgi:twitching motility protein PilT
MRAPGSHPRTPRFGRRARSGLRYPRRDVSKLGQLLSYLERPGVTELVFRSGAPAVMHSANRLHPLTVAPLTVSQIRRFFEDTQVITRLPKGDDPSSPQSAPLELLGASYQVTIAGSASAFEVRIGRQVAPRASTWTDMPATDVPTMRERRPASAGRPAASVSPHAPRLAAPVAHDPRDSSSGMLAASPEWTIERNDDHGLDDPDFGLVRPDTTTRRDMGAVPLRRPPQPASTDLLLGDLGDSSGSAPMQRAASAPVPAALPLSTLGSDPAAVQRPASAPVPAASRRPASAPVLAASRRPASAPAAVATPVHPEPRMPARTGMSVHPRLRDILGMARQQAASDVHIMSSNPLRVRRAGALEPVSGPVPPADVEAMAQSLLQPAHAEQLATLGYTDLAADVEGAGRVRINISRQRTGLKLCFRLVVSEPASVAALGLPPEVHKLTVHHQGMVIVSGPNGHGKTTSMAALVDLFNAGHSLHIITVEDPVEVVHPRKQAIVTQREVGTHTRSFARALAGALREDPDVIAIGELRDRETVEMALSAAETGHLVIATMSTPSGAKTIDRMIDMFPPDDQAQVRATLAGALKLVLSQRLLRRADGSGLVAAFEMISGGIPLWSLIRDNKLFQLPSLLQRGRNFGMIGLEDSLRELLAQGVITLEEALVYADDPKALAPRESSSTSAPASAGGPGWRPSRGR